MILDDPSGWAQCNHKGPVTGKKQAEADGIMTKTCAATAGSEGRGRGHEPGMWTASRSGKKARKTDSPLELPEETSSANTLILAQ